MPLSSCHASSSERERIDEEEKSERRGAMLMPSDVVPFYAMSYQSVDVERARVLFCADAEPRRSEGQRAR